MTTKGKGGVCRSTDLVQRASRACREKKKENLIPVCLADCGSYLNSLLHATTLVRSTPKAHLKLKLKRPCSPSRTKLDLGQKENFCD